MALVYPVERSPSYKTVATVNLSTNVDGVTNSDVCDCGGLALSAIHFSTLVSSGCNYTFKASADSATALGTVMTSSGATLIWGTTAVTLVGAFLETDPAFWSGVRFLQLVSNTTSAPAANATGATAKLIFSAFGTPK